MKNHCKLLLVGLLLLAFGVPVWADWDEGDGHKMHWPQFPNPEGWDICMHEQAVADDFKCSESGPITDIHFWVSWRQNEFEWQNTRFTVAIYDDIPNGPCGGGMPGAQLWSWTSGTPGATMIIRDQIYQGVQGWHCPLGDETNYPDHDQYWQINIIDIQEPVVQEEGKTYWLVIRADREFWPPAVGWKTSLDRFQSCSLYTDWTGNWQPVFINHPVGGEVDQAFVITGGYQDELDWGDAPDQPYPTLAVNNGANHLIIPGLLMGASIDSEPDGQPTIPADGDDVLDGNDDEDGVTFSPLIAGQNATMTIDMTSATMPGAIDAWIDFNRDGTWGPAEQIATAVPVNPGAMNPINFNVPAGSWIGSTYARVRLSSNGGLPPFGPAPDGEVEDYEVWIDEEPAELDWGDAEDYPAAAMYPTLAINNGAYHVIVPGMQMGWSVDADPDGQPTPMADGDDNDGNFDEDGVIFLPLVPGNNSSIGVDLTSSILGGFVQAWIDFNQNGSWADLGEQIVVDGAATAGNWNFFNFNVPASVPPGTQLVARVRFASYRGVPFNGPAQDGEVEDHLVFVDEEYPELKWSQLPDLSRRGMDVDATHPKVLADDFQCSFRGKISDIKVFGSWLNDLLPQQDPGRVKFTLSIHKDIPADESPTGYSMPGEVLWIKEFFPHQFHVFPLQEHIVEGWYDPEEPFYTPTGDTVCWLYHFIIPPEEAFCQKGDPNDPIVYWLDVQAEPEDPSLEVRFGWKSSINHWNDDAVWGIGMEPYSGPWYELIYPAQHPQAGESVDLAFEIMTSMPNYCCNCPDFDDSGTVNYIDYARLADEWLSLSTPAGFNSPDLDCDGDVDIEDLRFMAQLWLSSCPW